MDFNSRRITAILENALLEDRATRDATSYACIDPNQRASATILAKQDCILAGIGCVAASSMSTPHSMAPSLRTTKSPLIPKFSMACVCTKASRSP